MDQVKLFCLPYAGGSSVVYTNWKKYLHNSIKLCAIELAGRGRRFNIPLYNSLEEAVNDIYDMIKEDIDSGPYAIFGHSMGSILAYELAYKIKDMKHSYPLHIFFSGKCPPEIKKEVEDVHLLPDKEFMDKVFELGGTPEELLENRELIEFFTPILRADFKIIEIYKHIEKKDGLDCDITVLWGKQEKNASINDIAQWQKHTHKSCKIHLFNGGHFFINEFQKDIITIVDSTLIAANESK